MIHRARSCLLYYIFVDNQLIRPLNFEISETRLISYEYIKQLEHEKQHKIEQQDRKKIGYKRHDDLLKGFTVQRF